MTHRSPHLYRRSKFYESQTLLKCRRILWNSKLSKSPPSVSFDSYNTPEGLKKTLDQVVCISPIR